ncbi:MAG TPA: arylamine N-acetyltransferase [Thermoanaerobaculia bacterium]|jgi:N-hydroxyarylamine O-acetyltransferase
MNMDTYLARLGYHGPRAATEPVLRELHRRHLLTVPFENLDIHWNRTIVLDETRFIEKIVDERRGGFCYELNGAFAALLRALGFDVQLLSARPAEAAPEFDHMALLVDSRWLADVGFGESFLEPLDVRRRDEQHDPAGVFRIEERGSELMLMGEEGKLEFFFTLTPHDLSEFEPMCHYQQTSPESHFTKKRVCSVATEAGRITLTDDRLIVREHGVRTETLIAGEEAWRETLRARFGF